jgi:threonine dehydratase
VRSQAAPVMTRRISIETIREAAGIVYEAAVRTPLVRVELPVTAPAGTPSTREIFLKLETLQPVGSFKIRGAYNAVRRLPPEQRAAGVWTVSAGNAAQGVALAARLTGARASVLVMDTAPETKLRALERLGADIVKAPYEECWRTVETRQSERMHGQFVHPFDDDHFISGNGTIALEIVEDLPDVDAVIAPIGGGGLIAGLAAGLHALRPGVAVYAAEPATAAPLARSLAAGVPSRVDDWTASFVDGAGGRSVLESMWPLLRHSITTSLVVDLPDVARAMRVVADHAHVIAEGAAGCAVAAALAPGFAARGHTRVVAIVSGGNIDLPRFAELTGACG